MWQCPSFSLLANDLTLRDLNPPRCFSLSLSAPQLSPSHPEESDFSLFHSLSSHCSISLHKSVGTVDSPPSSPSAQWQPLALLRKIETRSCFAGCRLTWALIVCVCELESSEASALHSQLHDMIDTSSHWSYSYPMLCTGLCSSYAEVECVLRHQIWLFYVVLCCLSCQVLNWVKCNSVFFFVLFCFLFLCNVYTTSCLALYLWLPSFWAGTVLPNVNADCFTPDVVYSGDIFMSKKRWILYFPL